MLNGLETRQNMSEEELLKVKQSWAKSSKKEMVKFMIEELQDLGEIPEDKESTEACTKYVEQLDDHKFFLLLEDCWEMSFK